MNIKTSEKSTENYLFPITVINKHLLTIKEASVWATRQLGKNVTTSNISYLIQYGRIKKIDKDGNVFISLAELNDYYNSYNASREASYKEILGDDINWTLSFDQYKEAETTKHVHRLHPYKGKFIPQLVEYFLDSHIDNFKKKNYFKEDDIILDPFAGSGTTLVQASELGMNAIGIDISAFNALISNTKIGKYNIYEVENEILRITDSLLKIINESNIMEFEEELLFELNKFNSMYFPVPEYKYKLRRKEINEEEYAFEKEKMFLPIYKKLLKKHNIDISLNNNGNFLDKWFFPHIRKEINFVYSRIKKIKNQETKNLLSVILTRTMRSCRATTHADLATLIEPVTNTYYCSKHGKMCKPLFSILKWWKTYSKDTIERIAVFNELRTNTEQLCLIGDSRNIDIFEEVEKLNPKFGKKIKKQRIKGIFSSPPYVGMIDYHEQHAYAYELLKYKRNDDLEIGPLFKGKGLVARTSYIEGISTVLNNCKKYLADDYDIFLVANDKFNMYPEIAEKAKMIIIQKFHRPVLNRTEKDKNAYSETIFHLKDKI